MHQCICWCAHEPSVRLLGVGAGTGPHTREQMWEGHLDGFLYVCDFLDLRIRSLFWKKQKRKWEHICDTCGFGALG